MYDPAQDGDKAEEGYSKDGFEFLGCKVVAGLISPNKKARERLLKSVSELLDRSIRSMSNPVQAARDRTSCAETLVAVSNILRGWGDHYSFCNDRDLMAMLDRKIDERLASYSRRYDEIKKVQGRVDAANNRRLLGVHLLYDSKQQPILPLR